MGDRDGKTGYDMRPGDQRASCRHRAVMGKQTVQKWEALRGRDGAQQCGCRQRWRNSNRAEQVRASEMRRGSPERGEWSELRRIRSKCERAGAPTVTRQQVMVGSEMERRSGS